MIFYYRNFNKDCLDYFDYVRKNLVYTMKDMFNSISSGYSPWFSGFVRKIDFDSCDVGRLYSRFFGVDFDYTFISAYRVNDSDVWCYINTDNIPVPEPYQSYLNNMINYDDNSVIFNFSNYDSVPVFPLINERVATYNYVSSEFNGVVYHYLYLLHYKGVLDWIIRDYSLNYICIPDYCVVPYDYLSKIKDLL